MRYNEVSLLFLLVSVFSRGSVLLSRLKALRPHEWPIAITLLDDHQSDLERDRYAVSATISLLGQAGEFERALGLFHSVAVPDLALYHSTLVALAKSRQGAKAESLLWCITPLDCYSLNLVLMAHRDDWKSSFRIAKAAQTKGVLLDVNNYFQVISACLDSDQYDEAGKLLIEVQQSLLLKREDAVVKQTFRKILDYFWKTYSHSRIHSIRALVSRDPSMGETNSAATKALLTALGCAADEGVMRHEHFSTEGARVGYCIQKINRSIRLADFLLSATSFDYAVLEHLLALPIVSLGGGPGFDFVGAAILSDFLHLTGQSFRRRDGVRTLVADLEPGWQSCVSSFENAMNSLVTDGIRHHTSFGSCDITKPLSSSPSILQATAGTSSSVGNFLLIYICNFHALNHLLLIYICKLHWNRQ